VDRVHVARFDRRFSSLSAQRFVDEVLVQGLATRWLLVGRDFRFGAGRQGDYTTLEEAGRQHGFEVESMPDVLFEGSRVSSSAVRALLRAGDLGGAERLLGHPYTISGRVVHGAKLGRSLGFPTANIVLRRAPPLSGIFVVEASGVPGGVRTGVASIGRRPTVNPVPVPLLVVHLFGWQGELYGQHLRVRIMKKLRDEEKYADLAALKAAIARDAQEAREYLANHG
jgi:riboflavin kinase/FMN adenylyltransferase